jgi:hypothetical protein
MTVRFCRECQRETGHWRSTVLSYRLEPHDGIVAFDCLARDLIEVVHL